MPQNLTRIDYAELDTLAATFGREAAAIEAVHTQINAAFNQLQSDWLGSGADAFQQTMQAAVLPANQRLISALYSSQDCISTIIKLLQEAEKAAAALFQANSPLNPISTQPVIGDSSLLDRLGQAIHGHNPITTQPVLGRRVDPANLPPPRIYIVNGINATEPDGTPNAGAVQLRELLIARGYDPDQVVATNAIYNDNHATDWHGTDWQGTDWQGTELQGTHLQGTHLGSFLSPIDWITGAGAATTNGITGLGASTINNTTDFGASIVNNTTGAVTGTVNGVTGGLAGVANTATYGFNTADGASEVLQEYYEGADGKYSQEIYRQIQQDIANNKLLPGQQIILVGHSGGGAVISNVAAMVENGSSRNDVIGVVSMGSPVVNTQQAMDHAHYVNISDMDDTIGQQWIRSGGIVNREVMSGINPYPSYYLNSPDTSAGDAHSSYWTSNDVVDIIKQEYPEAGKELN